MEIIITFDLNNSFYCGILSKVATIGLRWSDVFAQYGTMNVIFI